MPRIVVIHDVADVDKWLESKPSGPTPLALSGSNVVDHVGNEGSRTVAVAADVIDVPALPAALSSPPPALLEIMERHGVVPPLTMYVEQ